MAKGRTQTYYDKNPEANKKRLEQQKRLNATKKEKDRRVELNKINRKNHAAGKSSKGDGMDVSHTRSGKVVLEKAKTNRARNGHGNNKRLK